MTKVISKIEDLESCIGDYKAGLYSDWEFMERMTELLRQLRRILPKDRFEAGTTKEEWERLGEMLFWGRK